MSSKVTLRNQPQVFRFRSIHKPNEDAFCLELARNITMLRKLNYDDVTEIVASHLGVDDSTKIRLTLHNCQPSQPKPQPISIVYKGELQLPSYRQISDILYYEVLDTPAPELRGLETFNIAFHHGTKNEVLICCITLPIHSTVGDLISNLKTKVQLSHPNAQLRLLRISFHRILEVFPLSATINTACSVLCAEEIPEEEINLGPLDYLIRFCHHIEGEDPMELPPRLQALWCQQHPRSFYQPFLLRINEGESLAEVKVRLQNKLQISDDELSKWKFKLHPSFGPPYSSSEYFQDSDIVSSRFQKGKFYDPGNQLHQYIEVEHFGSDGIPKSADITNLKRLKTEQEENEHKKNEKAEAGDPYKIRCSPIFQQIYGLNHLNTVAEHRRSGDSEGPTSMEARTSAPPQYPNAGQLYEEGRYRQGILDENFEDIGGFSVSKTQALLYSRIWLKYGHIASSQVLTLYSAQVTVVTNIMNSIMDMHQRHLGGVTPLMLDSWEDMIKMAEQLKFNIKWLREHFENVKRNFNEMQKRKASITLQEKFLEDARVQLRTATVELKKAEKNLSTLEFKIGPLLLEEKKLDKEKSNRVLFDGLL